MKPNRTRMSDSLTQVDRDGDTVSLLTQLL